MTWQHVRVPAGAGALATAPALTPDPELTFVRGLTRRLPRWPGAGRLAQWLLRAYLRRPRPPVVADVLGARMALDPAEFLDQVLLFIPQFWDPIELDFVRRHLRPGDTFVDIGAHLGLYSLVAAALVGPSGRVLAIDADPTTHRRLVHNLSLNDRLPVQAVHAGVADRAQTLRLAADPNHNQAANSFLFGGERGVEVACRPLLDIVREAGLTRITGAKLDIEGFEYRALSAFLASAERPLWPEFVIVEVNPAWVTAAGGHAGELLRAHGYVVRATHEHNIILTR